MNDKQRSDQLISYLSVLVELINAIPSPIGDVREQVDSSVVKVTKELDAMLIEEDQSPEKPMLHFGEYGEIKKKHPPDPR